jgi:peptidoglycan/xylan/chitin deacetylase (PgdA/CDA1 family)
MTATSRERIKQGVRRLAYLSGFSGRKARSQHCIRFLMFHDVGGPDYPLAHFEKQLHFLARHFTICPLPEAIARLQTNSIAGSELVLTFDDGLESHASRVYPLLERLRLPVTFFVCPGLIEAGEGIWTLETRARLAALPPGKAAAWLREVAAPDRVDVDRTVEWMKALPDPRCRELADHLREFVESERIDSGHPLAHPLMSWNQLRGLDATLVTIGSHSLTHPMLPVLEVSALEREIRDSQLLLEERLQRPSRVFCYPDGAHDARVADTVRRYYDAALTTVAGVSRSGDDLHTLRRIPAAHSLSLLAWRLHRPRA